MNFRRTFGSIVAFTAVLVALLSTGKPSRYSMGAPVPKELKTPCPTCVCLLASETGFQFGQNPPAYWKRSVLVDGDNVTTFITAAPGEIDSDSARSGSIAPKQSALPSNFRYQHFTVGQQKCPGVIAANSVLEGKSFSNPVDEIPTGTTPSTYCPANIE